MRDEELIESLRALGYYLAGLGVGPNPAPAEVLIEEAQLQIIDAVYTIGQWIKERDDRRDGIWEPR